jgi:hypothetical protein
MSFNIWDSSVTQNRDVLCVRIDDNVCVVSNDYHLSPGLDLFEGRNHEIVNQHVVQIIIWLIG